MIFPGLAMEQVRPAPGYPADRLTVMRRADRDGWWWVQRRFPPGAGESRMPETSLLNARLWKRIGVDLAHPKPEMPAPSAEQNTASDGGNQVAALDDKDPHDKVS